MTTKQARQRGDFSIEEIEAHKDKLNARHYAILKAAICSDYKGIEAALQLLPGTVKSRLNRARTAIAAAIAAASNKAASEAHEGATQ